MCLSEGAALHIYSGSALTFSHKFSQPSNADGMDPYITNARGDGKAHKITFKSSPQNLSNEGSKKSEFARTWFLSCSNMGIF